MIFVVLAGLALAVLALLLSPLWQGVRGAPSRAAYDRTVYRDQLRELERDRERGLIGPAEAEGARLEIARRLLAAEGDAAQAPRQRSPRLAVLLGVAVLAGAAAVYWRTGAPLLPEARVAAAPPGQEDMARAAAELTAKVKAEPGNADAWRMLARTQGLLGHWQDAADAFGRAAALAPGNPDDLAGRGEMTTMAAQGMVTPAARADFAQALLADPGNTAARFYLALADAQAGEPRRAVEAWNALLADLPAGIPMRAEAERRIAAVAKEAGIPVPAPPPPAAPEAQRDAMIRGMVASLAAKMEASPGDVEGWLRLGRAYAVLGEAQKSADAYARAASLRPDDPAVKLAEAQTLLRGLSPGTPLPARAVAILRELEARDPKQPEALWYLGVDAAQRGQFAEARAYWQRLLAVLPVEGEERRMVGDALDAIKRR